MTCLAWPFNFSTPVLYLLLLVVRSLDRSNRDRLFQRRGKVSCCFRMTSASNQTRHNAVEEEQVRTSQGTVQQQRQEDQMAHSDECLFQVTDLTASKDTVSPESNY